MTSSSRRIIKRPSDPGMAFVEVEDYMPLRNPRMASFAVEDYVPPLEQFIASHVAPKAPVFPRYTPEGVREEDWKSHLSDLLPDETSGGGPGEGPEGRGEDITPDQLARERKILEEQKEEEARLLKEAREEAARILEEAERRSQEQREQAAQEGRREGYEAGYREGRRHAEEEFRGEIKSHLAEFEGDMRKALDAVDAARERCLRTYLEELKDCAIAIGEKVIHISLRSSGEVIKQMIISATEKLKKTAWVKIYMDKYDYDMMMEADAGVIDELSHLSDNIKFIVMDKEDRGSCIIEMPEEIVDVSVNTQIENIKDILENVRI